MPNPKPVTVIEEAESGLTRQRWVFSFEGKILLLDRYFHERRRSVQREFEVTKFYDRRRDPEDGDYGTWTWLKVDEVPWDADVRGRALAELAQRLKVLREDEL